MNTFNTVVTDLDDTTNPEVIDNSYEAAPFIGANFDSAARAVDYWVGQHTIDASMDEITYGSSAFRSSLNASFCTDLRMYRPSHGLALAATVTAGRAIREILEHSVCDIHELPANRRGLYLAQLVTRSFSDGIIDLFRFRVAQLLAAYIESMPAVGTCTGVITYDDDDLTLVGWSSAHGNFLDLVHVVRPSDEAVDADVAQAMGVGLWEWPHTWEGVRYLPLSDLAQARYYHPDGSHYPFLSRDLLATR